MCLLDDFVNGACADATVKTLPYGLLQALDLLRARQGLPPADFILRRGSAWHDAVSDYGL